MILACQKDIVVVAVVAIAASVAVTCNFLLSSFTCQPKPFCDTDPASDVLISGFVAFTVECTTSDLHWNLCSESGAVGLRWIWENSTGLRI
ncbi:hypothetical protein RJ641_035189 [Dillenia turbinata]|uniref:Uncharacterized protein n=1 Tax=Dillenia turbinata TaxID=194707 RepID=A0AAN8VJW6_9MAGN